MDADLPGSVGLTQAIASQIDGDNTARYYGVSQLLHLVVGAMIQHDTGRGGSAFAGIDVERVFAAVKALKDRETIDLSAFVESWNRNLDASSGETRFPGFWADSLRRGLSSRWDGELEREFERGVRAVTEASNSDLFEQLETAMLDALVKILRVDEGRVSYLEPMIRAESLQAIATLNYDLAVEKACAQAGLTVDSGLDTWDGGYDWTWVSPPADVRLLKLHGSLDYVLGPSSEDGMRVPGDSLHNFGEDRQGTLVNGEPAMVFGAGSKLRSDGPFLAMLVEFDRLLADTQWLTIVGYSFRDDHINAALTRWLNSNGARRLSVIDPSVREWNSDGGNTPRYWNWIARAVQGSSAHFDRASCTGIQHDFIPKTAAAGLAQLFGSPGASAGLAS